MSKFTNHGVSRNMAFRKCKVAHQLFASELASFNYEVGEIHLGVPQAMEWNRLSTTEIASEVAKTWEYMKTVKIRKSIREICKNKNKMCTIWSLEGECEQNPNCE